MATPAQIHANQINAQYSTGPRTPEGKAAVAQNRTSHGLAGAFSVLPCEDREAFAQLLRDYETEYQPATPTERFLVTELAQAQWRIQRADAIEAELLNPGDNPAYTAVADKFRDAANALDRLGRYAAAARRAYYKAQDKLQQIRREQTRDVPMPTAKRPIPVAMPQDLQRELDFLRRKNPDFNPQRHASSMTKRLRRYLQRAAA